MTISPEVAETVGQLCGQYFEWMRARIVEDDVRCASAHAELKSTLHDLRRLLPPACPYCEAEMGQPDLYYDQEGYSVAEYECPQCHALVVVKHVPPDSE